MNHERIGKYQEQLQDASAREILEWALSYFGIEKVALATSLSYEDQVVLYLLTHIDPGARVFTLDTGRLFQETYDLIETTQRKYNINIEMLFPNTEEIEDMVNLYGPNFFYNSIENRKLCCKIRKVNPLRKKLNTLDAWITGLRREQAVTRQNLPKIEWDESNQLVKINPIADWSEEQVVNFVISNNIPSNKLHGLGYPSIGCLPCTRAVNEGEDIRSGRWWWEKPEEKECGLHCKN